MTQGLFMGGFMRAFFPGKDPQAIIDAIRGAMQGRKLGEVTQLELRGSSIVVCISKIGTSTLEFTTASRDNGTEVRLTHEKLALAHRPFRDEVRGKLSKVVQHAGGDVLAV
jgi:hypothetical protein